MGGELALGEPGVSDLERVPMLRGRITRMRDIPVEQLPRPSREGWVLQGDRGITWSASLPKGSRLVAGSWWPADYKGPPLVSLDAEVAGVDRAEGRGMAAARLDDPAQRVVDHAGRPSRLGDDDVASGHCAIGPFLCWTAV